MNPKYPIYIISKGRWESRLTVKALEKINVPYYVVVEKQEYKQYTAVIDPNKVLILPKKYLQEYDIFDDAIGKGNGPGPGAARNFCWDHSIKAGFKWHWVMDDNITGFYRLNDNLKVQVASGTIFKCAEEFINRYINVGIAGFNYFMFASRKSKILPYYLNTRIYSCLLIKNNIPYRWRGRYNEDTDLSLRALKDGLCTVLFNAFLCYKLTTQTIKGGNSEAFYDKEGTLNKSKMQVKMHPDVSKLVWKFNRWHHHVDYSQFKKNKLIKKPGIKIKQGVDNYGMLLVKYNSKTGKYKIKK